MLICELYYSNILSIIKTDSRDYLKDSIVKARAAVLNWYGKTSGSISSPSEITSTISKELKLVICCRCEQ